MTNPLGRSIVLPTFDVDGLCTNTPEFDSDGRQTAGATLFYTNLFLELYKYIGFKKGDATYYTESDGSPHDNDGNTSSRFYYGHDSINPWGLVAGWGLTNPNNDYPVLPHSQAMVFCMMMALFFPRDVYYDLDTLKPAKPVLPDTLYYKDKDGAKVGVDLTDSSACLLRAPNQAVPNTTAVDWVTYLYLKTAIGIQARYLQTDAGPPIVYGLDPGRANFHWSCLIEHTWPHGAGGANVEYKPWRYPFGTNLSMAYQWPLLSGVGTIGGITSAKESSPIGPIFGHNAWEQSTAEKTYPDGFVGDTGCFTYNEALLWTAICKIIYRSGGYQLFRTRVEHEWMLQTGKPPDTGIYYRRLNDLSPLDMSWGASQYTHTMSITNPAGGTFVPGPTADLNGPMVIPPLDTPNYAGNVPDEDRDYVPFWNVWQINRGVFQQMEYLVDALMKPKGLAWKDLATGLETPDADLVAKHYLSCGRVGDDDICRYHPTLGIEAGKGWKDTDGNVVTGTPATPTVAACCIFRKRPEIEGSWVTGFPIGYLDPAGEYCPDCKIKFVDAKINARYWDEEEAETGEHANYEAGLEDITEDLMAPIFGYAVDTPKTPPTWDREDLECTRPGGPCAFVPATDGRGIHGSTPYLFACSEDNGSSCDASDPDGIFRDDGYHICRMIHCSAYDKISGCWWRNDLVTEEVTASGVGGWPSYLVQRATSTDSLKCQYLKFTGKRFENVKCINPPQYDAVTSEQKPPSGDGAEHGGAVMNKAVHLKTIRDGLLWENLDFITVNDWDYAHAGRSEDAFISSGGPGQYLGGIPRLSLARYRQDWVKARFFDPFFDPFMWVYVPVHGGERGTVSYFCFKIPQDLVDRLNDWGVTSVSEAVVKFTVDSGWGHVHCPVVTDHGSNPTCTRLTEIGTAPIWPAAFPQDGYGCVRKYWFHDTVSETSAFEATCEQGASLIEDDPSIIAYKITKDNDFSDIHFNMSCTGKKTFENTYGNLVYDHWDCFLNAVSGLGYRCEHDTGSSCAAGETDYYHDSGCWYTPFCGAQDGYGHRSSWGGTGGVITGCPSVSIFPSAHPALPVGGSPPSWPPTLNSTRYTDFWGPDGDEGSKVTAAITQDGQQMGFDITTLFNAILAGGDNFGFVLKVENSPNPWRVRYILTDDTYYNQALPASGSPVWQYGSAVGEHYNSEITGRSINNASGRELQGIHLAIHTGDSNDPPDDFEGIPTDFSSIETTHKTPPVITIQL